MKRKIKRRLKLAFKAMSALMARSGRLTEKERIAAELIYSLNSAFWFTWIAYRETSLEKALAQNAAEAVEKHLHRILAELTARNFSTFLEESERTSDNGREKRR